MSDEDLPVWWELTVDMDGDSFTYHMWEKPQGVEELLNGLEPEWIRFTTTSGRLVGFRAEQAYHVSLVHQPVDYDMPDQLEEPPKPSRTNRFRRWKPGRRKQKTPSPF